MKPREELVLIDGNSLLNRAFYALPLLTGKDGQYTNAVYGFANMLVRLITEYSPAYIAVAFDVKGGTFRNKMYEGYKATRHGMPEELAVQLPVLREMLDVMGIRYIGIEGIEADDIIGTLAAKHKLPTLILTGDRDSFQLISDTTTVLFTRRGITEVEIMTPESLKSAMGLSPSQIVDYKALAGDSSDNIPGVQGIGNKRACELLSAYGSVAGVYAHIDEIKGKLKENLEKGRQSCEMSYALATIKTDCDIDIPVSELTYRFPFSREVMEFFDRHDFKSLTRRTELFGESVKAEERYEQAEIIAVRGAGELLAAADGHEKTGISFSDGRISLSPDGTHQYDLELKVDLISDGPTEGEALRALAPLLADEKIIKYVYDVKSVIAQTGYFRRAHTRLRGRRADGLSRAAQFQILFCEGFAETLGLNPYSDAAALIQGGRNLMHTLEESGMNKLYREMELPLTEVLFDMQKTGFKLDLKLLEELKRKYTALADESTERIYELAGRRFNINSPKQLGIVLFDELKLPYPKKRSERSTSAEILGAIKDAHPVVEEVLRYRFVSKINQRTSKVSAKWRARTE